MTRAEPVLPVTSFRAARMLLRQPFTPAAVRFKPQSKVKGYTLCVAYIDARLVIERLNLVVGEQWDAVYEQDLNDSSLLWCALQVFDTVRCDVGQGRGKGRVSDALKRAAVQFGVGVSLYAVPQMFLKGEVEFLKETHRAELRGRYETWLKQAGISHFGEPFDHGDAEDSQGDVDAEVTDHPTVEEEETATAKRLSQLAAALQSAGMDPGRLKLKLVSIGARADTPLTKLTMDQQAEVYMFLQSEAAAAKVPKGKQVVKDAA